MEIEIICVGCENVDIEHITFHRGTLLCSYCLDDWLKRGGAVTETQFHDWLIEQRTKMRKDRGEQGISQ